MKTEETQQLERDIRASTRKLGVFGCFEVTIGGMGNERVDYMTYEPAKGIFRCYEIKVTKADFHSKAAVSFVGHYNYYVLTKELYKEVKEEIPPEVGVYVGQNCVKKAKRSDTPEERIWKERRTINGRSEEVMKPFTDVLLVSMVRSLYRDSDKLLQTENEQYVNRLRQTIDKRDKRIDEMQQEYNTFFHNVAEKYGYNEAWKLTKKVGGRKDV